MEFVENTARVNNHFWTRTALSRKCWTPATSKSCQGVAGGAAKCVQTDNHLITYLLLCN